MIYRNYEDIKENEFFFDITPLSYFKGRNRYISKMKI